jgi:hypothetical protein
MTPSELWIIGLFAVYAIPSFLFGVGLTLVCVQWRALLRLLSPERTFAAPDQKTAEVVTMVWRQNTVL